jgi:phage shock protein C
VRQSPQRTAREIGAQFRDIDRRLAEVETYYVTSNPRLNAEIERLR